MPRYALIFLNGLLLAAPAWAEEATRPAALPPPVSGGSLMQIMFSLLLVVAVIVLVGWLLKRMNMVNTGPGEHMKLLGGITIGQRERIILVEARDTWLVVGVVPGQIRTLHTLPKPDDLADDATAEKDPQVDPQGRFAALLRKTLDAAKTGKNDASS